MSGASIATVYRVGGQGRPDQRPLIVYTLTILEAASGSRERPGYLEVATGSREADFVVAYDVWRDGTIEQCSTGRSLPEGARSALHIALTSLADEWLDSGRGPMVRQVTA